MYRCTKLQNSNIITLSLSLIKFFHFKILIIASKIKALPKCNVDKSAKRQIYLHFLCTKTASREKNKDKNRRWKTERERALDGPLIAIARSLFIFVHFGARDNALVTQTAKCGQNAQAATRLALEGTRVVYDPAESAREKRSSWRKIARVPFTPARTFPTLLSENRSPAATPTSTFRQFGPSANTLRYQSTDIYRYAIPNDC